MGGRMDTEEGHEKITQIVEVVASQQLKEDT
jgi:hypothetical protein